MDKVDWLYSLLRSKVHRGRHNIGSTLAGRPVLTIERANDYMYEQLLSNKPFMACRFGSTELRLIADAEAVKIGLKNNIAKRKWNDLNQYSGFFPNDINYAMQFADLYYELVQEADLLAVWNNAHEDYMLKKYAKDASISVLRSLEPWYTSGRPWTAALQGKKVLVIHPFTDTILKQYLKREVLFDNDQILPEFELHTIKAVQTLADETDERFATWFDALEYMYEETQKVDFDVAILGCGAYGLPLAAKLKRDGKKAIHMGGATQLLFGIKGARWDNHPIISKLYNENWVRPSDNEGFKKSNSIEGGCYW